MKKFKETDKNRNTGMAIGMCFGMSIGLALANSLDINTGIGMCMGMSICMCLGLVLGASKDKVVNKQLEEQGYTIRRIEPAEAPEEFAVTIVNHDSEEKTITMPIGALEAETLKVGDVVYLDEEGYLEQVYYSEHEL